MDFRITGLAPELFKAFFQMDDAAHAAHGEELVLLAFEHQPAHSPVRAVGPIFVRKSATAAFDAVNIVPEPVRVRLLSVRAYDAVHMIVEADVVDGCKLEDLIDRHFLGANVVYVHVHYARRSCYAYQVDRV